MHERSFLASIGPNALYTMFHNFGRTQKVLANPLSSDSRDGGWCGGSRLDL
jgi:hypothetical protein